MLKEAEVLLGGTEEAHVEPEKTGGAKQKCMKRPGMLRRLSVA